MNKYWLYWQLLLPGQGRRLWQIINYFGSPEAAWHSKVTELSEVPLLGAENARLLGQRRNNYPVYKVLEKLHKLNCSIITIEDTRYPKLLKQIFDPPLAIFVRGKLPVPEQVSLAVVGSRLPTPYGLAAAEKLSKDLAETGICIISGMARGIDSAAHRGALKSEGYTCAVLGCGPDIVYPRENKRLMEEIIEKGAVISEFPPGMEPAPWQFPARNRIISGISRGVVVVEAATRSGALITADFALEQGREVFALPGNINSSKSVGTNMLIRQGAHLVTEASQIIEELGLGQIYVSKITPGIKSLELDSNELIVWTILCHAPMGIDDISGKTDLTTRQIAAALTTLELKGKIRVMTGGLYVRADL